MPPKSNIGGGGVLFLSCLSFCPRLWNFNRANNFWTVSASALIFHMNIPCEKTFTWVSLYWTVTLTLEFDPFFENFILANNFWTVSASALIFLMNTSSDKIFLLVLNLLTLTFDPFFERLAYTLTAYWYGSKSMTQRDASSKRYLWDKISC